MDFVMERKIREHPNPWTVRSFKEAIVEELLESFEKRNPYKNMKLPRFVNWEHGSLTGSGVYFKQEG